MTMPLIKLGHPAAAYRGFCHDARERPGTALQDGMTYV